jgi:hypothetical protein
MLEYDTIAGPSFTTPCGQCGDVLIAPESSEHATERHIRHLWLCEACGLAFETTVYLIMRPAEIRASLRKRAEECLRLFRELPNIEHKSLMRGLANGWILLSN